MLSILIPTYNYDIVPLVKEIQNQALTCEIPFEILAYDDGSNSDLSNKNEQINELEFCSFKAFKTNIGRTSIRKLLAKNAQFANLLFLDADVIPKKETFIQTYLSHITTEYQIVFGGFAYSVEQRKKGSLLRWKYGKTCEEIDALYRNRKPYKVIISANMLVKKDVFSLINSQILDNAYGLDNYFGALLKENNIKVLHINNEVFHLGIDSSAIYLKKKEEAANTLLQLFKEGKLKDHSNNLFSAFIFLKKYKLNYFFFIFFNISKTLLRKNLLSNNPSIKLLQLYRLSYMCYSDLKYQKQ